MRVLFPSDYFSPKKPDEMYSDQFSAFQAKGFGCATINLEELNAGSKTIPKLDGHETLYRGWMLTGQDYETLCSAIVANGGIPFTNVELYLSVHHLPRWYSKLGDLTPETVVFDKAADLETELKKLNWKKFFIKDYVKSLKTSIGSVIESADDIGLVVSEMEKYRGKIEGGICVRRVEAFIPETEKRFFVVEGKAFSPDDVPVPEIVEKVTTRIGSRFYSIDIIKNKDGVDRVVEVGDGQVSDIVGWSPERFVEIWNAYG